MEISELRLAEDMEYWSIPGAAVSISLEGKEILCAAEGCRDLKKELPVDIHTRFCIASCTKAFTTAIALLLQKQGKLNLLVPVKKYLPEFTLMDEAAGANLCLHDMFTHISGLPGHDFMWPYYEISDTEFIKRVGYLEPSCPFRMKAQYNNIMYILAGLVEERVSGKTWGHLVKEYLFEPLGLTESYVSLEEAADHREENLAEGYRYLRGGIQNTHSIAPKERASGSIVMSSRDHLKWMEFQISGKDQYGSCIFTPEELAFLHEPRVIFEKKQYSFEKDSLPICYGYGWYIREYRGKKIVYHHGATLGFCSLQACIPEAGLCMSVLENGHGTGTVFADAILFGVIDRVIFGEDTVNIWRERYHDVQGILSSHDVNKMEEVRTAPAVRSAEAFCGSYENDAYGEVVISEKSGSFFLSFKGFKVEMLPYDGSADTCVFRVQGLVADTEFYTLPACFRRMKEGSYQEVTMPLEDHVEEIVFRRR
ncbi:MAG: serine hydrolase [Lachnospiraceae bacterium]